MATTSDLVVMLDGATIRTETGCRHGAAWYTRKLGAAIIAHAASRSVPPRDVLASAIREVAGLHSDCDLRHPGTPSAAVGIVRLDGDTLRYLVLGDITVVLETTEEGVSVVSDQRISASAAAERAEVDRYRIGTPEKASALITMKHAELAARNTPDGYWIAAADPAAAQHAVTGEVPMVTVRRLAVLTDGAARTVDAFGIYRSWQAALDALQGQGPNGFFQQLRETEAQDPRGAAYPRNKVSDDATVVLAQAIPRDAERKTPEERRPFLPREERISLAADLLYRMDHAQGDGMAVRAHEERRAGATRLG